MIINADLGEHEPPARTMALMELIGLANIACGGHAGTPETMQRCVALARAHDVAVGAHPGLAGDFGRGEALVDGDALATLVRDQAGALSEVAGGELHHIKLHGALYHAVENSRDLAIAYVAAVKKLFARAAVVAFAGGLVRIAARESGVRVLEEVFAERGYRADGTLIPRGQPGDLIENPAEIVARLPSLRGDTICIHADSPNAVAIATAVRMALGGR